MADENGTTNTEEPPPTRCCDILWIVTTMEGWLKLVEAIMTLLTFSILASHPYSYLTEFEYLVFVATTAFIFVVLHIVLRITHLFEKFELLAVFWRLWLCWLVPPFRSPGENSIMVKGLIN